MGGIGSDVFGEHNAAQNGAKDRVNDFLRDKFLREYLVWHRANGRFHDSFEDDLKAQKRAYYNKWIMTGSSALFAAVIVNPNFTRRRSYYARKIIPAMFGLVAYQYGYRCENLAMTNLLL